MNLIDGNSSCFGDFFYDISLINLRNAITILLNAISKAKNRISDFFCIVSRYYFLINLTVNEGVNIFFFLSVFVRDCQARKGFSR